MSNKNQAILAQCLPVWEKLNANEKKTLMESAVLKSYKKGEYLYGDSERCLGILLIERGELRLFMLSDEGREVTLFTLEDGDACVLSASCVIDQITFDVHIEVEEDAEILMIPSFVFARVMRQNVYLESFVYKNATERFSDVMYAFQQLLFNDVQNRIVSYIYDESIKVGSNQIEVTHEKIAKNIGTAREVVSRLLKQLSKKGIIELQRGKIVILDKKKLKEFL